jgi:hypothetical protein
MRDLAILIGLSSLLTGCVTEDRGLPGREPFYRTADTAKNLGLLTPAIAKECSDQVASKLPQVRIVGPFSISPQAAYRRAERPVTLLPTDAADNVVAVAAPSLSRTAFGGETKTMSGCLYRLRDNRLVFEKVDIFGSRIDVARTQPDEPRAAGTEQ